MKTSNVAAVRKYKSEDLQACRGLWNDLTQWHRHIYDDPGIGGTDPGSLFDKHLKLVGPEHVWVAERDGEVVGMAGLIPGENEAELEPLVVKEEWRGRGIGHLLTLAVIGAARQSGARLLTVRPVARNDVALRFFHRIEFDVLGQIELVMDFRPTKNQKWRHGENLTGKTFRL